MFPQDPGFVPSMKMPWIGSPTPANPPPASAMPTPVPTQFMRKPGPPNPPANQPPAKWTPMPKPMPVQPLPTPRGRAYGFWGLANQQNRPGDPARVMPRDPQSLQRVYQSMLNGLGRRPSTGSLQSTVPVRPEYAWQPRPNGPSYRDFLGRS